MPIAYPQILEVQSPPTSVRWTERDTILYALGTGLGRDPLDDTQLPFVYEKNLRALPTQATVITWGAGPTIEQMGFNAMLGVHAQEKLEMHRPLPPKGEATASGRVVGVEDRGDGKGALITWQLVLADNESGEPIATMTTVCMARGDGGFGGPQVKGAPPHAMPSRAPDKIVDVPTSADQALVYRLSGDMNPLHADPKFAKKVGFERPILHGLCTYSISCHAVLKAFAGNDPDNLKSHQVRFSAPVIPGDLLTLHLWQDQTEEGNVVSFEVHVKARDAVVIKSGKTVLR